MPSHPIATWITPCSSRKVQASSTSNRRHTIGLIPSSQTLTCTTPIASGTGDAGSASALAFDCFEGLGTSQTYRARPYAVASTTHFLMVPKLPLPEGPILVGLVGRYVLDWDDGMTSAADASIQAVSR